MYYDRRTGTYFTVPQPPKAYQNTKRGNIITPEELKTEWECSVEWGCTNASFDEWRECLLRQGVIKAIY